MDHISRFIIAVTHDHLVQTAAKCYLHILWIAWGDHFHLMWITRLYRINFVQIVSGCSFSFWALCAVQRYIRPTMRNHINYNRLSPYFFLKKSVFANCNVRTTTCKWCFCFVTVILQFTTCNFIIAFLKCNAQTLTFTVTTMRFMVVSQLLCACWSTVIVAEWMGTRGTAIKTWNIFIHSIAFHFSPSFFFKTYSCYQLSQTILYQSEDLSQMPRKSL